MEEEMTLMLSGETVTTTLEMLLFLTVGDSMLPTYEPDTLLFAYNPNEPGHTFEDVKVGDVVVVRNDEDEEYEDNIIHRVIDVETDEDGERYLVLMGDNNDNPIEDLDFPVYEERFRGVVVVTRYG